MCAKSPHKRGDVPLTPEIDGVYGGISPQAWGCTGTGWHSPPGPINLPTSVGMYRSVRTSISACVKSPHKRGDVPSEHIHKGKSKSISPQAWGCTDQPPTEEIAHANLPTSVGMYLFCYAPCHIAKESPHKRGDVPQWKRHCNHAFKISPQAWGCTVPSAAIYRWSANLPTSVGMYRLILLAAPGLFQSPHKRGDVPFGTAAEFGDTIISPQAWGCTVVADR